MSPPSVKKLSFLNKINLNYFVQPQVHINLAIPQETSGNQHFQVKH